MGADDTESGARVTRRSVMQLTGAVLALPATPFEQNFLENSRMSFTPRFVDLVRNTTTTVGTGNFVLGSAVNGFTSFATAIKPGESFYYSAIGVERPNEREVGRGTMEANGTISRQAISGVLTNFSSGSKTVALIAASEWYEKIEAGGAAVPAVASTRAALSQVPDRTRSVILQEAGREGIFVFDGANLSSAVSADASQGILIAPQSDASGASGAWRRKDRVVTPQMFGAAADGITDDAAALKAFFDHVMANRVEKAVVAGHFALSPDQVVIDGSPKYGGSPETKEIDWGNAIFTSLSPGDKLITVYKCFACRFVGKPEFRGSATGYGSDAHASWATNVGLFLDYCGRSQFDGAYFQGFRYAGVEIESTPGNNNAVQLGMMHSKRVGSGDDTGARSLTANWSGATTVGSTGSVSQRSVIGVDAFPDVYISGPDGIPAHQILVEIAGRPHFVYELNRAAGTLEVYPRIRAATGTSGTLRYHYGATVVFIGNDSNIATFDQISALSGGCALEVSSLYGGSFGQVHAESCGSALRLGAEPASQMNGGTIAHLYCEGSNVFNVLWVSRSSTTVKILSRSADASPSKDIAVHVPLQADDSYNSIAVSMVGLTTAAIEGWHYPTKTYVLTAEEALDFNEPATFRGKVFYTKAGDTAQFELVAPDPARKLQYGYDAAEILVVGRGTNGAIAGSVSFTPPAGHSINGGAVDAVLTIAGGTYSGPSKIGIVHTGPTTWAVHAVPQGSTTLPAGDLTITGRLMSSTSTSGGSLSSGQCRIGYNATAGAYVAGRGTTYDFVVYNRSAAAVMLVPGGTQNAQFAGSVLSVGATSGIGYGTGAGGSVTQTTSRTTGVTLNTACGSITLASAAGSPSWQSFIVTNSAVAPTDTVRLCQKSGADKYRIHVTAVAAGSFEVTYATTGGTTTEQPVFNFAIIKGAAA